MKVELHCIQQVFQVEWIYRPFCTVIIIEANMGRPPMAPIVQFPTDCLSKLNNLNLLPFSGSEWSEESFIYDDGKVVDGDNLGAILVDDDTASIFLFFTLCPHHKNCTITSMMYMKSVDDGISWQKPVNISASMKGDGFPMPFGPGRGIQVGVNSFNAFKRVAGLISEFRTVLKYNNWDQRLTDRCWFSLMCCES